MSGPPYPGQPLPTAPFPAGAPFPPARKQRSLTPLILGFLFALLLVGSGCFGGGYLVGYGRGKVHALVDSTAPTVTSTGSAPASSDSSTVSLTGSWRGSYTCNQGKTGLILVLAGANSDLIAAFSFYPLSEDSTSQLGKYIMKGTYSGGTLALKGDHWLKQPDGYQMVDLTSTSVTAKQITGTVEFSGCSTFTLARV